MLSGVGLENFTKNSLNQLAEILIKLYKNGDKMVPVAVPMLNFVYGDGETPASPDNHLYWLDQSVRVKNFRNRSLVFCTFD